LKHRYNTIQYNIRLLGLDRTQDLLPASRLAVKYHEYNMLCGRQSFMIW